LRQQFVESLASNDLFRAGLVEIWSDEPGRLDEVRGERGARPSNVRCRELASGADAALDAGLK
jgi:hypothetical protein